MKDFTDYQKELCDDLKKKVNHWRRHKELLADVLRLAPKWTKQDKAEDTTERKVGVTYAEGLGTIHCVSLDLYLGKNDSISKDVQLFIDEQISPLVEKYSLEAREPVTQAVTKWKAIPFGNHNKELYVRAFFGNSNKCKLTGTGHFEEKMEVMCE